ncbi:MAG: sugar ABC transporter substrate-binding protein, partial [Beijerinckiaceae bacterium]
MKTRNILASIAALDLLANAHAARAAEYYVGDAIEKNNLVIEPNYLTGIEMSRMPEGMTSGPDVIHLEVDVHAAAHEPHGFAEKEWIPYLTV